MKIRIGKNKVTFEYLNKTYTLDVDVKIYKKKEKEFVMKIIGKRINHTNETTTELEITEFIPLGKVQIEGDYINLKEVRLNVNARILAGDVSMYGQEKAKIIKML